MVQVGEKTGKKIEENMQPQVNECYFNVSDKKEFHSECISKEKKSQTSDKAYFIKGTGKSKYRRLFISAAKTDNTYSLKIRHKIIAKNLPKSAVCPYLRRPN